MATGPYTLLDLASRSGIGVQSLIEGVLTYAPEFSIVPAFPKAGLSYTTLTRSALPTGSFRKAGQGVGLQKSEWNRNTGSMCIFEAAMQIAEDIALAAQADNPELATGDILSDEAIATLRGSMITLGQQFWYGQKISADGFVGLSTIADSNNIISAGGAGTATTTSAYLVLLDPNPVNPEGVHLLVGNGGRMQMADQWIKQQVNDPADSTKKFMAFVNNFLSYLGLVCERKEAIYQISNLDETTHGLTDALAAQLWRKVPLALRADTSRWRWFMGAGQLYMLQKSRSTVYTVTTPNNKGIAAGGAFPDMPDKILGVGIQPTDSLITTETNGLKA